MPISVLRSTLNEIPLMLRGFEGVSGIDSSLLSPPYAPPTPLPP